MSASGELKRLILMLVQTVKDFANDNGPQWAAAVSFYALLSFFPLLLAAVSIAAYFANPDTVLRLITDLLGDFLPTGQGSIQEIVDSVIEARGTASIVSIALLLWTGSRVFSVLTQALNIAFDSDDAYSFFKRLLINMAMLLTLGVLLILAFGSRFLIVSIVNNMSLIEDAESVIFTVAVSVISALLLVVSLFLVYNFVPQRSVNKRMALLGAVVVSAIILGGRPIFNDYVSRFGEYNLIYGSLAILIIVLVWVYLVSMFILFGGQLASHAQDVYIEGKTVDEIAEVHRLRSPRGTGDRKRAFRLAQHTPENREDLRGAALSHSKSRREN